MSDQKILFREMMMMVTITDVTLREFGQNVKAHYLHIFTPDKRAAMAIELYRAGLKSIEVFSCVSPRVAPAMNKSDIGIIAGEIGKVKGIDFITLVPNRTGYQSFLSLGLGPGGWNHCMGLFFSAVESHNMANVGMTIEDSMKEFSEIFKDAGKRGVRSKGYVSAAFGYRENPSSAEIRPTAARINHFINFFFDKGAEAVTLSDLQGLADAPKTKILLEEILEVRQGRDIDRIGYHPHHVDSDMAIANSMAALELGINRFDASLGGTGGCITGAPGNQPTEKLIEAFCVRGIETGVDLEKIKALAAIADKSFYQKIQLCKLG
jgi:hydroxymethylglutaryl-CoA lyase